MNRSSPELATTPNKPSYPDAVVSLRTSGHHRPLGHSSSADPMNLAGGKTYQESLKAAIAHMRRSNNIIVLSGAGMSTAAGIPDFRSPGGLYGSSERLLESFTYLPEASRSVEWQRACLADDVRSVLTHQFFRVNPLPYHEMRRGLIIGLGEGQWKLTIAHVLPELLNRNGKLRLLASQNIDGLDHKVVSDKSKLYNPHGLMSTLVTEPKDVADPDAFLATEVSDAIYQKYVELVKANVCDIYADRPARQGKSSHLWPGPERSTPITLEMFGSVLPPRFKRVMEREKALGTYSVKPGSVLFDMNLWIANAAGGESNAFAEVANADLVLVMGTSLSGLTIDHVAHMARDQGRIVLDMTPAPVESLQRQSGWDPTKDAFLQGPLDRSVLDLIDGLGWSAQIFDFLPHLCLGSLQILHDVVQARDDAEAPAQLSALQQAIEAEVQREKDFYGEELLPQ